MSDRNTLLAAGRQLWSETSAVARSTATHKRIRCAAMGRNQGGGTALIDTRGWDAMRWFTANHRYQFFATETTVTSDNWLTGDNDAGITLTAGTTFARIFNADGTYGSRNKLKQIITDGTRHLQVWERGTVDQEISKVDASTTGINGTQLYQSFWPSNYKVGTGSEGNGRPTGKSYFARDTTANTTSLGTNAEIIATPGNGNWGDYGSVIIDNLGDTYKHGEFVIELIEPWDPSIYTEADSHEHTIANCGATIDSPYYTGDVVERADYRPAFYKGTADGFAMSRRSAGFCTNPPPFVALRAKLLRAAMGGIRYQMLACYDLYVDLFRNSPHKVDIGGGHELQNRERGDAWTKAISEE